MRFFGSSELKSFLQKVNFSKLIYISLGGGADSELLVYVIHFSNALMSFIQLQCLK